MKQKRLQYFDIAKGITILLVILGHTLSFGWKRELIFSFHMPLFIICSGYFFKNRGIKEEIKILIKTLLIPYICWLFIYNFLTIFLSDNITIHSFSENICLYIRLLLLSSCSPSPGKLNIITGNIGGVGSLWFIPMLIMTRIIFLFIKKISKENHIMLFCIVIMLSFIGYILGTNMYYLPFMLDVAMYSLIFYYIGYVFNIYKILDKIKIWEFIIIVLIFVIGFQFSWNELVIRRYPTFSIVIATAGTLSILLVSKYITNKINFNFLTWVGKNTMNMLGIHQCDSVILHLLGITKNSLSINPTLNKIEFLMLRLIVCISVTLIIFILKTYISKLVKKTKYRV